MESDPIMATLASYASQQGVLSIDDIRNMSYRDGKLFFRSFAVFLKRRYPEKAATIIAGLLSIKSCGLGIILPYHMIENGLHLFPGGYLEQGQLPTHDDLSFLTVVCPAKQFPIETFPSRTTRNVVTYLKQKGANVNAASYRMDSAVRAVHPTIDFVRLMERRLALPEYIQSIDDREVPLTPEIVEYALEAPSVLFESFKRKERFVVALPGVPGNHAEADHEQAQCYFNNEAIFARQLAAQGKKVTILDLDASFGNGAVSLCLGKENIALIGVHVDPAVDPMISERKNAATQRNSFQYGLEAGTNGRTYLAVLNEAFHHIPKNTDVLLVVGGVNSHIFDSIGLLCVEARYFKEIGKAIGEAAFHIPKIIVTQAGGYEKYSHLLFVDLCVGIADALDIKQNIKQKDALCVGGT